MHDTASVSAHKATPKPARTAIVAALSGVLMLAAALTGCTSADDGKSLPGDFPVSVQLVSGRITAVDTLGDGWLATVAVDGEAQQQQALERLTDAGFVVIGESGAGPADTTYSLANATLSVRLSFGKNDSGYSVSYAVAKRTT